jgi:hypothetical protein
MSHGWLVGKVPDFGSGGRGINPQVTLAQKTFLTTTRQSGGQKNFTLTLHENHTQCKLAKNVIYFSV